MPVVKEVYICKKPEHLNKLIADGQTPRNIWGMAPAIWEIQDILDPDIRPAIVYMVEVNLNELFRPGFAKILKRILKLFLKEEIVEQGSTILPIIVREALDEAKPPKWGWDQELLLKTVTLDHPSQTTMEQIFAPPTTEWTQYGGVFVKIFHIRF